MKYSNHRSEPYFTLLKNGQKTIEGRLRKDKYAKINAGDQIEVSNEEETEKVEVLVKRTANYPTFREMLTQEPLKKVLPNVATIDEGVTIYRKFYSQKDEDHYGVVAIEVELKN